ncbi:MAG TPA: pilus assembly protein N-terminal domain-containing protein [Bryobacteraceae bacterium]|nr:pilus assembly protein N-terminal domain-containing protein [Bryobacteraceae bacterium]
MKRHDLNYTAQKKFFRSIAAMAVIAASAAAPALRAQPARELVLTVGKSLIVNSAAPIERVAVGFGEIAEATPVGVQEVLLNAKAPGETSLIVWQKGGSKLFFDVVVRANQSDSRNRLASVRTQIQQELAAQNITVTQENGNVFLRGTVRDLNSAERAVAIASTIGKVVNLLYVQVPESEAQILLKVRFASVDRSVSSELGLNLISTGATNTVGTVGTQQFPQPRVSIEPDGSKRITLSDALNIFLFRQDLNLGATIRALQTRGLFEILAEPNVLAINGRQASFVAGGEFPYPILQGGGAGLGAVTIQFREFGVRINFIPMITPRGTIRLEVAPEVSALDFTNGLTFQGFTIPGLTLRRVQTGIELQSGQSFAIGGLLDRRLQETFQRIPLLGDVPLLGKLFQSRSLQRQNTELLVIVTPELVRPIPAGQAAPELAFPKPLSGPDVLPRTPGMDVTGPVPTKAPHGAIPVEQLIESLKSEEAIKIQDTGAGGASGTWPGAQPLSMPGMPSAPAAPK